jgi:aspartate-semialdehyde dehydrogenase
MSQVVAIAGATGAVGTEFVKLLEQRNYPLQKLKLLASARSVGKQLRFRDQTLTIEELRPEAFQDVDVAFFSAGGDRSKEFAPVAVEAGVLVIDNSSAFRMDEGVPLVVPEINVEAARQHKGLIANPNCSTIQMVVALNPLHQESPLQRVVVSTYQAVSGAGASGMQELLDQVRDYTQGKPLATQAFPKQILFNLIPHIDVFQENGYTKEEMKMVLETRKIMSIPELPVSATCVRVPVLRAHSESIWVETETKISVARARELFVQAPGIQLVDERKPGGYPVPWEASETFDTYVGRVREDLSHPRGLSFWCVADQLYKGAALNAIQIAEVLLES